MMEYIIAAVVLAVAVGAYFYMKKKEEKEEPKDELWPWEQVKPKRPKDPPPNLVGEEDLIFTPPIVSDAGWGVELEDFGGALDVRPEEGIPGWEIVKTIVAFLPYTIVRWRNPETGQVQWVDYNPQKPDSMDWYYIASGCVNLTPEGNPMWNALWITAEKIDSRLEEEGLQRVRDYKGGLRSNPEHWPEPYRTVYLESH